MHMVIPHTIEILSSRGQFKIRANVMSKGKIEFFTNKQGIVKSGMCGGGAEKLG